MPGLKSKKAVDSETSDSKIVVTAQQTRFHDTDEPASKDIEIHDLSISVGKREILEHTKLIIKSGLRYAFVGRNGLGKSTVLKALAERRIPGVAANLRILLLGQTHVDTGEEDSSVAQNESQSVIDHVMTSDKLRQRLLNDSNKLSTALENKSGSSEQIVKTTRKLQVEQAIRELAQARLIAERRSGARGSKARQIVKEKEKALEEAEKSFNESVAADDVEKDINAAMSMLETLQLGLESMNASTMEARARSVLIGLGFSDEQIASPVGNLSGGWRTRASLAAALVQQTDVLLLDEPTNFLDLPAVIWLQHYLTTSLPAETSLVVTTHDRDFADAIATNLLILRLNPPNSLETFSGTLSDYYAEKRRQYRRMTRMSEALDRKKAHLESTIQKSVSAAKRTGDDKKLKQAASRKKKLAERTGMEVNAKGHRFKLNRDRVGWHTSNRDDIEIDDFDPPVSISLLDQPEPPKNPGSLASFENVCFTYPKTKRQVLDKVTLTIHPGAYSRTALVGLNGSGKSTMVNLILNRLNYTPTKGTLALHSTARVALYSQLATEQLTALGQAEPTLTALSYLQSLHPSMPEQTLRAHLSSLSLHPQHQTHTPLSHLSGGQLVRVGLAATLLPLPPHLLVLDEPTTHLDSDSILALIKALKRYKGALLVVSHDRFFLRCVVEGASTRTARVDVDEDDEDDSNDESSTDSDVSDDGHGGVKEPGRVFRMTKTGKLLFLERGIDEYEEIVIRGLRKKGVEV